MNYAQIKEFDTANGTGVRTTLFVSGCTHQCQGCFNGAYQDFKYGKKWNETVEKKFLESVENPQIMGVTILGGEPFQQDDDLLNLLKKINKNIWIYSGYSYEEILKNEERKELLSYCDVLVDGPFIQAQRDFKLRFKGSRNQRIINVKKSLIADKVKLLAGEN